MHKREQLCISENKNTQAKTTTQMGASAMTKKTQFTNYKLYKTKQKTKTRIKNNTKR